MHRLILSTGLFVAIISAAPLTRGDVTDRVSKNFRFEANVCVGDPLGSKEEDVVKVLSGLSGSSISNHYGSYHLHYTVKNLKGVQVSPGYTLHANFAEGEDGKIRLRLTLEHTGLEEDGPRETVVRTSYKHYDRVAIAGETVRLRFGKSADKDTWLELRVREAQ